MLRMSLDGAKGSRSTPVTLPARMQADRDGHLERTITGHELQVEDVAGDGRSA